MEFFSKLVDIIHKPIELLTDWGKEPLRGWEHKRNLEKINVSSILA